MKIVKFILLSICIMFLLSACTTKIDSQRVGSDNIGNGYGYTLPATKLKVTLSAKIISCEEEPIFRFQNISTTQESVASKNKEDVFFIDIDQLKSGMKVIPELKIGSYDNTTLKKISYKAEDKTGEVIENIARVVALYNGIPLVKVAKEGESLADGKIVYLEKKELCAPFVVDTLNEINVQKGNLKVLYEEIYNGLSSNEYLSKLTEAYNTEVLKLPKINDNSYDKTIKNIATLEKAISNEKVRINETKASLIEKYKAIEKTIAYLDSPLTKTITLEWTPDNNKTKEFDLTIFEGWFNINEPSIKNTLADWVNKNKLTLDNQCLTKTTEAPKEKDKVTQLPRKGLYYKIPKSCDFKLFFKNQVLSYIDGIPLSQNGYLASLNVNNGPFDDNTYEIEFNTAGNLNKFEYTTNQAAIEKISTTVLNAADIAIETDIEKLENEKTYIDKQNELSESKETLYSNQLEEMKKKKELEDYIKEEEDEESEPNDTGDEIVDNK